MSHTLVRWIPSFIKHVLKLNDHRWMNDALVMILYFMMIQKMLQNRFSDILKENLSVCEKGLVLEGIMGVKKLV